MARQGFDWDSLPTTITTLQLLSRKWWQFRFKAITSHTQIDFVWMDSSHSHQLDPSNVSS
eukprot:scaffold119017_cov36-Cyclotella_meneghiniana.AAC.1